MTVLYPDGYGTEMVTLEQMKAKHGPKMHPEFARRFFAYIEFKKGLLGVGGGWRAISQVSAASAAGKSFHQDQAFKSGLVRYAAVDLVTTDGPDANNLQDAVSWDMTADAPSYGLHTFIKVPNEPWHIQCFEMRGWQTWVDAGRPDPTFFVLPNGNLVPPVTSLEDEDIMIAYIGTPPKGMPGNPPWLLHINGSITYTTNEAARQANLAGIPFVEQNAEQYEWMRKAAGI